MGRVREFAEEETAAPLSEALLFTTMCIIGLPVEVYIKDGSIFSGIFYTASVNKGYGIVLKKARMVKKGTQNTNVVNGDLIDTLVVRPGDLVQVLAKGVMLPADFASSDGTCYDGGALMGTFNSFQGTENVLVSAGELLNQKSHVGIGRSRVEDGYHHASEFIEEVAGSLHDALIEANHSTTTLNDRNNKLIEHEENQATAVCNQLTNGSLAPNGTSPNAEVTTQPFNKEPGPTKSVASEVSTSDKIESGTNARSSVPAPTTVAPQNPVSNRTAKESKLNPDAKIFSPSLSNFRSNPTPPPTVASVAYVPNSFPTVQVPGPQSEVGIRPFVPRSSWPVKVVPYVTPAPTTADNGLQHSQTIAGHVATRTQPVRHGAVYQPIQAVPSYLHANHQNGMFGRPGQFVYVHPVTHDVVQPPATLSQAPHPLFTSHPIHVTKHEGVFAGQAMQASMNPPLIANGPQPFMTSSHQVQLSPPLFSAIRPVPVLSPNVPYSAKFP